MEIVKKSGMIIEFDDDDADLVNQYTWHVHGTGRRQKLWYASASIEGKKVYLHRFIMKAPKGSEVDHIDHNGLNNRRSNLRLCSHRLNLRNQRSRTPKQYRGIFWRDNVWVARLRVGEKMLYLGRFDEQKDAARAYDRAAEENFGEYAVLNFARNGLPPAAGLLSCLA